jgi:predicted DNA-binding transcriptional regulator AlpA
MAISNLNQAVRRVLRVRQACEAAQISPATFWRRVQNDPNFPKPFPLGAGAKAVGIDAGEFDAWLLACKAAKR